MKPEPPSSSKAEFNDSVLGEKPTEPIVRQTQPSVGEQPDSADRTKVVGRDSSAGADDDSFPIGTLVYGRFEIRGRLGQGGFGTVYRAFDKQLDRDVAIKRASGLRSFVAGYVRDEAKTVASLKHPRIVAIYDLIAVSPSELLIVMECLEGQSLSRHISENTLSPLEAVNIGAQVLDALKHAHEKKIVHSDLKPGNLHLMADGSIKLLDFGLAVAYFPSDPDDRIGGTPGYMSPEQVRGEPHRIDGRVDIWAFGVLMYEMLTGSRPFVGSSARTVFDATLHKEVPPLRQLNPAVDEELQRIVLRCLQKRMNDRYDSVAAVQRDLQLWLDEGEHQGEPTLSRPAQPVATPISTKRSTSLRIRSRGLRPYGEVDADCYLSLVPGPRDRSGIPDSILFWKNWIESDDPDTDYPVGVLYGPSGSGKTSYIRAGLLPKVGGDVCPVYVECHSGNLAARVYRIIHAKIHDDTQDSSLRDFLNRLRSGDSSTGPYRKLLIVLDQFEAWAHQASLEERRDFAETLRQCDGMRIRTLVVTRDDYWMGVTELSRWLELPLQEGRNIASVDLLDPAHARQFLESAGRDLGTLPPDPKPLSSSEQQFIEQAVAELTSGGAVICVHLVMFAQMVRLQQWTPRGLRASGGVTGACSLFLQELFQPTAVGQHSPEYRRVAPAAMTVLSALMPDPGDSVAAVSKSKLELRACCEAARCAASLDDCLRILVEDLCIVTVLSSDTDESSGEGEIQYRLAHDFLVRPIADWIDRAKKLTIRGRASSRLAELTESWSLRQSKVQMPRFGEYLYLLGMSPLIRRNERQRKYMRAAARHHAGRISVAALAMLAFCGMTVVAFDQNRRATASRQSELTTTVDLLLHGSASAITQHMESLRPFGSDAIAAVRPYSKSEDRDVRLRASLFLQSQLGESFTGIAQQLAIAPNEYFAPILDIAAKTPDAIASLRTVVEQIDVEPSDQVEQQLLAVKVESRAAILLAYLGELSPLETLLAGTDDANIDTNFLTEAAVWRGSPELWLTILNTHPDPQLRYHAGVVVGSYPRGRLAQAAVAGSAIDFTTLFNHKAAVLHSLGYFLAHHMGVDVTGTPVQPPNDANWKVGPDNIPMVRLPAGTYEFYPVPKFDNDPDQYEINNDFWFATIPVSRQLYQEFLDAPGPLDQPNVTKATELSLFQSEPPDLRDDKRQPILGIDYTHAISFCNWLSRRSGLSPCYEYQPVTEESLITPTLRMQRLPWTAIDDASGYRLPTFAQFSAAAKAGYQSGTPWTHAVQIGTAGGDYAPARGDEYCRKLFSLIPNRQGIFANQGYCGSWGSGNSLRAALMLGTADVVFLPTASRQSIYLVQLADANPLVKTPD